MVSCQHGPRVDFHNQPPMSTISEQSNKDPAYLIVFL